MPFEVLTTRGCRWSVRNIAALCEKGAEFELVDVSGDGGKAPWYLELTCFGKTPGLRHGGRAVFESLVMNEFIDEVAPGRRLLPQDPADRSWARIWMGFCDSELIPRLGPMFKAASEDERDSRLAGLREKLCLAERDVLRFSDTGALWQGARPGLVDMAWWTFFSGARTTFERLGMEDEVARHPNLAAWRHALDATSVFARAEALLDRLGPGDRMPGSLIDAAIAPATDPGHR